MKICYIPAEPKLEAEEVVVPKKRISTRLYGITITGNPALDMGFIILMFIGWVYGEIESQHESELFEAFKEHQKKNK